MTERVDRVLERLGWFLTSTLGLKILVGTKNRSSLTYNQPNDLLVPGKGGDVLHRHQVSQRVWIQHTYPVRDR